MVHTVYVLALFFSATAGVTLLVRGLFHLAQRRRDFTSVMEAVTGVIVILGILILQFEWVTRTLPAEITSMGLLGKGLAVFSIVGGVLSIDYLLGRLWPLATRYLPAGSDDDMSRSRRSVLGATFGIVTVGLLGGTSYLNSRAQHDTASQTQGGSPQTIQPTESSDFTLVTSFDIPEQPTALAFSDREYGYLTSLDGRIFKFEPPASSDDSIRFEEVASGISAPQGVEVVDRTLYTTDIGELRDGQVETVRNSNGKVIAFDIASDGSLANQRTILSRLPVVDQQHSPNGITTGPDGRLYLTIGHFVNPQLMENGEYNPSPEVHPNIDFLGTVISFEPNGDNVEIMARGLRNVYDIAFDLDGDLFGADNDGRTARSMQRDTLYNIVEGGYYGYPEYGTFDDDPANKDIQDPLWVFSNWPAGIETADKLGYETGVLTGLWKGVEFVPIVKDGQGPFVQEPARSIISLRGDFPSIVEVGPDEFLYVGAFNNHELGLLETDS